MPNKVEIIITADNRAQREVTALNADVRALSDHLDRAGTSGESSTRKIADGADKSTAKFALARVMVDQLSGKLEQASAKYKALMESDADVSNSKIQSALDKIHDLQAQRESLLSRMANVGSDAGPDVAGSALSALPDQLKPALIAAAVGAAPVITSTISAAALLGFGGAGLAAGIAGAAKAPEVAAAWTGLAEGAQGQLAQVGEAFRAPLVDAIGTVDTRFRALDLASVTRPLAATVKPLSEGLIGLAERALPGVSRAVEASVPLINTLARELPDIGDSISDLGDAFAGSGDEANRAFTDILDYTEMSLSALANMITVLTTVSSTFRDIRDNMADWHPAVAFAEWVSGSEGVQSTLIPLNDGVTSSKEAFENAAAAAKGYADDLDRLTGAFDTAWGAQMSVDEATMAWQTSLIEVGKSVKDNGKTLDAATEAGLANRDALLGSADAAYAMFEAEVAMTGSVAAAGPKLQANLAELERQAVAAGLSASQVHALFSQYYALASSPDINKNINIKTAYTQSGTPPRDLSYANIPTGRVGGLSGGGRVIGGSGIRDDVPTLLMGGEIVLSRRNVDSLGGPEAAERWRQGLDAPSSAGGVAAVGGSHASGGGSAGGVTINVYALDPRQAASSVWDALSEWTSANGPIPAGMVASA